MVCRNVKVSMRIKPKSFFQKASTDLRKSVSLDQVFKKESEKASEMEPVRPFRMEAKPVATTKVTVNVSGNRRGMHHAESPPDSEVMRKRRAMRKIWNKKMPQLHCSNCQFSAQCPQFRAGYVCAFLPFMDAHSVESEDDLMFYMKELLTVGLQRTQQTLLFERLSGAKPSLETTESVAYLFNQFMQLHTSLQKANSSSITIETSDKGIIGSLFGSLDSLVGSTRDSKEKNIDTPFFSGEAKTDMLLLPDKTISGNADQELLRELAMLKEVKEAVKVPAAIPVAEELTPV